MRGPRRVRLSSVMVGVVIVALALAVGVLSVRLARVSEDYDLLRARSVYALEMERTRAAHQEREAERLREELRGRKAEGPVKPASALGR